MSRRRARLATTAAGAALAVCLVLVLTLVGAPGLAASDAGQAVLLTERGRGNPKAYAFLAKVDGDPVHWSACQKIGWRIDTDDSPKRAVPQAKEAVSRIEDATDLRFAYRGKTDVAPKRFSKYPEDTQLILGWGPPKATGEAAGVGGAQWDGSTGRIVHGYVVLNYEDEFAAGFGRGPATGTQGTLGQLMMHELGHAVGLQHVRDDQQIMYPTLTRKKATWGAGDRNGLRKVGKAAGCF